MWFHGGRWRRILSCTVVDISTSHSLLSLPLTFVQRSYHRGEFFGATPFPVDLHAYFLRVLNLRRCSRWRRRSWRWRRCWRRRRRLLPSVLANSSFNFASVNDFSTRHTMEGSSPLQSGRRRRGRRRGRRFRRCRWRRS